MAQEYLAETTEAARTTNSLLVLAAVYFVLAIVFGTISVLCLKAIAKSEGRMAELKSLFARKSEDEEADQDSDESDASDTKVLLNVPTIIAIVGTIAIIVVWDFGYLFGM